MKKNLKFITMLMAVTLSSACATTGKSILLGSAVGAGVGAGVGNLATQNTQGTLIGAASGAVVGGLIGLLAHKGKAKGELVPMGPETKPEVPFLTKPEVRSIWVPDKIEGNQYIQGHY